MRCEDFRVMLDNYADLTDEEKARLNEHAEHCPECKAELDFLMSVIDAVNTLPKIEPPSDFLDKLNKRIDAEEKKNKGIWAALKRNCRTYSGLAACLLLVAVIAPNGQTLGDKMMYPDDGALVSYSVTTDSNNKTSKYSAAGDVPSDKSAPTAQPSFGPRATASPQTGLFGSQRSDRTPSGSSGTASPFGTPSFGSSSSGTTQKNTSSSAENQPVSSNSTYFEAPSTRSADNNTATGSSFGSTAFGSPSFSAFPSQARPSGVNIFGGTYTPTVQNNQSSGASTAAKSTLAPSAPKTSADTEGLTAAPQPYSQIEGGNGSENTITNKNGRDESSNTAAGSLRIERPGENMTEDDYSSAPAENRQRESSSVNGSGSSSSSSGHGGGGGSKPAPPTQKPEYSGDSATESVPTTAPKPTREPSGGGSNNPDSNIPEGAPPTTQEATPKPTRIPHISGSGHDSDSDSDIHGEDLPSAPAPGVSGGATDQTEGSAELQIYYYDLSQAEAARNILSSYASDVNGDLYIIDVNSFSEAVNEILDIVPDVDLDIFAEGYMLEVTAVFNLIESNSNDEDTDTDQKGSGGDDIDLSSDKTASEDGGKEDTSTENTDTEDTDTENTDNEDTNTEDTDNGDMDTGNANTEENGEVT